MKLKLERSTAGPPGAPATRWKQLLQIVRVMKCQEPWWITLMITRVFWVTAVKSGQSRTECNMATTCPCRHHCGGVKATQAVRVNTPDKTVRHWWNAKSSSEESQTGGLFLSRRWLPAAAVGSNHVAVCATLFLKRSNRARLFSRHLSLPLLFYSWGSGFICQVLCCRFKKTNSAANPPEQF